MNKEFDVQFVDSKDRCLALEVLDGADWNDVLSQARELTVPQGTIRIEITVVSDAH